MLLNAPPCSTQFLFSDKLQRRYLNLNHIHVASGNYIDETEQYQTDQCTCVSMADVSRILFHWKINF